MLNKDLENENRIENLNERILDDKFVNFKFFEKDFEVNIGAVALQFPLLHPSVISVIPGMINETQVKVNIENLAKPIPKELWIELKKQSIIEQESPVDIF